MKRFLAVPLLAAFFLVAGQGESAQKTKDPVKEALGQVQDFIGQWKGNGAPEKARPASSELWSEQISWGWKFKGDDAWLVMDLKNGKYWKSGELKYLPDKKIYQLTVTDRDDKKLVFEGTLKNDILTLEHTDAATKEKLQVTMNSAAEGDRFIYRLAKQAPDSTIWSKQYMVAGTREGVTLGAKDKKNECIVSGGLGTMTVTYKGETYHVCCSGCRDAFNETPEKYVAEWKAKKKK